MYMYLFKIGALTMRRHSDMGSLTILFRQPVAALQVHSRDGGWKWVRPQQDYLTVNIADALQFLTSAYTMHFAKGVNNTCTDIFMADGYLKSSIHRVVAPPRDQAHIDRLGVLYMVRIEDDVDLVPISESPVLRDLGLVGDKKLGEDGKPVKAGEWVKQRVIKNLGATSSQGGDNNEDEVEIVQGLKIKYFE